MTVRMKRQFCDGSHETPILMVADTLKPLWCPANSNISGGIVRGAMFVYCILRLWKAGVAVLWTPYVHPSAVDSAASDPTTQVVRFALRQHLLVKEDAEGWSEVKIEQIF